MSSMFTQPIIALITDYGDKDGFVGMMKGMLYKTLQQKSNGVPTQQSMPCVVDVTHRIEPFNISEGAWTLSRCYPDFPENTIFIGVVDPAVGQESQRKLLLAWPERKLFFVGPDNGLFTPVIQEAGSQLKAFSVTNSALFRQKPALRGGILPSASQEAVSQTFHGRDIYAPVAAHLAHAVMTFMYEEFLLKVGERVDIAELVQLDLPKPTSDKETLSGYIAHTDHFGNLTTNIPASWIDALFEQDGISSQKLVVELPSKKWVGTHLATYAAGKAQDNVFVVPASTGTLELALYQRHAGDILKAKTGDPVVIRKA